MFEFQIGLNEDRKDIAKSIMMDLKKSTTDFNIVITNYSQGNKTFIVLACDELEKPRMSFYISQVIADIISTFYKLEFIEKNLRLPIQKDINYKAFKKALIAFDRETDKYIIARNLKIEKTIFIDSFYEFRLKQLRTKWMELIKLANDNAGYLLCNDIFIDLLKFLIENIEISRGLVNVVKEKGGYKLCDEQFEKIDDDEILYGLSEQEMQDEDVCLVLSLIALSPKKINVYCNPFENSPTLTLLSQIFDNRVSILPQVNEE